MSVGDVFCCLILFYYSDRSRGELDYKLHIVGLYLCLVCRLVSYRLAAFFAAVDDNIAALGVGKRSYRAKYSAATVLSVTGVYINVERAKAEGAMIARGVAERKHLSSAILAGEAVIVFCESFSFHLYSNPSPAGDCIQLRL